MTFVWFVLGLLTSANLSNGSNMPRFSWDTLPVAWHGSNPSGMFSPENIQRLAKYPVVSIEKWQALDELYPDPDLTWLNCQHGTDVSKCGCCTEDKIVELAKAVKEVDPTITLIAYFHSWIGFPSYHVNQILAHNPDWWATNEDGSKACVEHGWNDNCEWGAWNHAIPEATQAWKEGCLNLTQDGIIDSCFFDHCEKHEGQEWNDGWLENKLASMVDIQTKVNGPVICGSNGNILEGVDGSAIQNWGKGGRWSTREIPMIQRAVEAGVLFEAHTKHCPENANDQEHINNIAAFLIGAGPYSYYRCGSWHEEEVGWYPIYDYPLGEPLGDAVLEDHVWKRSFASGTTVTFDTKKEHGTIDWAM